MKSLLELDWSLSELPTSQHRAGLAGLVLMVRWLKRQPTPHAGICELTRVSPAGTSLRVDLEGLSALFDQVYAASTVEEERNTKKKNQRTNREVPPLRPPEVREVADPKTGKVKPRTVYIYADEVPDGAWLRDVDPTAVSGKASYLKLWREVVWRVVRAVPKTRLPYQARASKRSASDAVDIWNTLVDPVHESIAQKSHYLIGAMEATAENVSFYDRPRLQLLLHFWPHVVQVYELVIINREGKEKTDGYALAVPDVAELQAFCEDLPPSLASRSLEMRGYRLRDATVDLAVESGLEMMAALNRRLGVHEGRRRTSDLVLGVDVFHRKGSTLVGSSRIDPDPAMLDEYERVRRVFRAPLFRRQRMANVLARRPWYAHFDQLLETTRYELTIGESWFCSDAFSAFRLDSLSEREDDVPDFEDTSPPNIERLVYSFVGTYVIRRVESKYDLVWNDVKNEPTRSDDYNKKRNKVAKEAFLAVRSRTNADFVSYFAATLASVPQFLREKDFIVLTRALMERPEDVRTLTLLALLAHSWTRSAQESQS